MNKNSPTYGRPKVVDAVLDRAQRRGHEHQEHLPGGARHQGRAAGGLFARDRPVLRADQPRLHGLRAVPRELHGGPALCRARRCRCIRRRARPTWATSSPGTPRPARSSGRNKEQFSVWSGALATAGGVVFYGTLEGYLKAVDAKTGKELYKFKTPSGIIGNVMTYEHGGKQYVAILSGVGGWAGIGLAAGLTDPTGGPRRGGRLCRACATTRRSAAAHGVRAALSRRGSTPHVLLARCPCAARQQPRHRANGELFGANGLRRVESLRPDRRKPIVKERIWAAALAVLALAASTGSDWRTAPATRRPSRTRTASISTRPATRPTRSRPTARSTGTPIRAIAAITPNATSAMAPTAKARPTRRR